MNFSYKYLIFFFVMFLLLQDVDAQCSMCKQAVSSSADNPNSLARSLNSGILYLMAVPYLMIAFIFRKQIMQLIRKFRSRKKAIQ